MKRTCIITFILLIAAVSLPAQQVTYIQKKVSLLRLFKEIRKQTGVSVIWNEADFNVDREADANFMNARLSEVMDELAAKLRLNYTLVGKMIIIKDRFVLKDTIDTEYYLKPVEIVNTGYQNLPRERSTGSFVLVNCKQFNRKVSSDVFGRLEGITNGLSFNRNTIWSNKNDLDLSIRGRSTIYSNDQPLIILDNFPYIGDLNSINPNDVAQITVLKDAAAAAIWGVRAGNGVIVVDTKRGKFDQRLGVSVNSNVTIAGKPNVFYNPNYLSSVDFIALEQLLFEKGKFDEALNDKVSYPIVSPVVQILNNQRLGQSVDAEAQISALGYNDIRQEELEYYYRRALSQQYSLSFSGGTLYSHHYFSLGLDKKLASLINNDNDRISINSQNAFKLYKNIELEAGAYYLKSGSRIDSTISQLSGASFTPYYQFKNANGSNAVFERGIRSEYKEDAVSRGFLDWSYIPLDEQQLDPKDSWSDDVRLNTLISYNALPGLNVSVNYQYQYTSNRSALFNGLEAYATRNLINRYASLTAGQVTGYPVPLGGIFYETNAKSITNSIRGQLNYQMYWDKHTFSALMGYELSENETSAYQQIRYGYDKLTGTSVAVDSLTVFSLNPIGRGQISTYNDRFGIVDRFRSSYANLSYTYNYKYTLSGSARIDGSNYFGVKTNSKNVPLWSVGGLWNLDTENFYSLNWLPVLKMRASFGYNGNLDKRNTGITTLKNNALGAPYTNLPYAGIMNIGNPELRWEKIGTANFGLEFGFKDQVISGRLEYYLKYGSDIIGDKAFPSNAGIRQLRGNYAEMRGAGIDLSLNSKNLRGKLKWETNLLFSVTRDQVTSYEVSQSKAVYYVAEHNSVPVLGKPVYGVYSYKWAGLDPANGNPRGYINGVLSNDYREIVDAALLADLTYHGPARPSIFGAFNNSFSYGIFTLDCNINYKMGYFFKKASVNYHNMFTLGLGGSMHRDFEKRWRKTGDEAFTTVPSMVSDGNDPSRDKFYIGSSANVAPGDHIRLQDLSLSVNLDNTTIWSVPLAQLRIYCYVNNLGLIWKANGFGLDPDYLPAQGARLLNPSPTSFSLGIKADF